MHHPNFIEGSKSSSQSVGNPRINTYLNTQRKTALTSVQVGTSRYREGNIFVGSKGGGYLRGRELEVEQGCEK